MPFTYRHTTLLTQRYRGVVQSNCNRAPFMCSGVRTTHRVLVVSEEPLPQRCNSHPANLKCSLTQKLPVLYPISRVSPSSLFLPLSVKAAFSDDTCPATAEQMLLQDFIYLIELDTRQSRKQGPGRHLRQGAVTAPLRCCGLLQAAPLPGHKCRTWLQAGMQPSCRCP